MRVKIIQPTTDKKELKKKVCAYARVSTDTQSQGESLENQIAYYKTKIEAHPDYTFVGIFADKGLTGTKENRPQFQAMLKLCREGKIDIILTKSISRFARNTTIVLEYVRELKLLDIEVHFKKENIKTLSEDGELMLTVLSSFAEEESRSDSENIKWRVKKNFKQGKVMINTKRLLGYDKNEYGDLIINKKESEIFRRIFTEYLKGNGCFKMAKALDKDKVPTVTSSKWSEVTISNILRNEKYKGDVLLQETYIENHLSKKQKGKKETKG